MSKPILFSGPMVRALREKRKTQTRRLLLPRHAKDVPHWPGRGTAIFTANPFVGDDGASVVFQCPYGQPGDLLWVRENIYQFGGPIEYAADGDPSFPRKMTPSIHMPRWASRLTLRIKAVRVERLQEISEEDALAEGATPVRCMDDGDYLSCPDCGFRSLWDSINATRGYGWEFNPYVWMIAFDVIHANVDQVTKETS